MKEIVKRCLAGMLAILLVLTSFTSYVQADEGTSARSGNIVVKTSETTPDVGTYGVGVGYFTIKSFDGNIYKAYCACHEKKGVVANMVMAASITTNEDIRKCLYYGDGGPMDQGYGHTPTSLAISVANGHMDSDDTGENSTHIGTLMLEEVYIISE